MEYEEEKVRELAMPKKKVLLNDLAAMRAQSQKDLGIARGKGKGKGVVL